jgi:isopenicillin N synthase-like dioxygenase
LVEQQPFKLMVAGSNPARPTLSSQEESATFIDYLYNCMKKRVRYIDFPILEYADISTGDLHKREQFAEAFVRSIQEDGFVTIAGHPLPTALRTELYAVEQQFFELPDEVKQKYERLELYGERGYVGKDRERSRFHTASDLKEYFSIGRDIHSYESREEDFIENIWPFEVPRYRHVTSQVYEILYDMGRTLLGAVALWLKLDQHYFDEWTENANHTLLRALHYYPLKGVDIPKAAMRSAPHTDINLLTLLIGATAAGLQIQHRDGRWITIPPRHENIIVDAGDMLARLTNNRIPASIYRVTNPPRSRQDTHRYSAPFFLHPHAHMELAPLPGCIDAQHPIAYDTITAAAFLDERLRELRLIY